MSAPRRSSPAAVHATLLLVQLLFALHYVAAKLLLREIPPRVWAPLRISAAALLLWAWARATGRPLPADRRTVLHLGWLSIFGIVINQLCFVEGLARTTPSHASILVATIPLAALAFAVLFGRERPRPRQLAAVGLGFFGVMLVLRPDSAGPAGARIAGDLLQLANAFSYAFFLVVSKPLLERTEALGATAVLMLWGALGMVAVGLPAALAFDFSLVSAQTWLIAAWIVACPTAGAYVMISWASARTEASRVAAWIYLQPLCATALSAFILGERPAASTYAGACLILLSVYFVVRRGAAPRPVEASLGEGQAS